MTISKFTQGLDALLDQTKKMNADSCETLGISPEDVDIDPADDNSIEDDGSSEEESDDSVQQSSDKSQDVEDDSKADVDEETDVAEGVKGKVLNTGVKAVAKGGAQAAKTAFKAIDKSKLASLGIKGGIVYAIGSEAVNKYFDNGTAERLARDENAQKLLIGGINFLKTEEEKKTYADVFAKNYQGGLSTDQCKELALSSVGKTKEELDGFIEMSKNAVNNMTSGGQNGFGWKDAAILGGVAVAAPLAVHYGKKLIDKIRGKDAEVKKVSGSKRKIRLESIELCEDGEPVVDVNVQTPATVELPKSEQLQQVDTKPIATTVDTSVSKPIDPVKKILADKEVVSPNIDLTKVNKNQIDMNALAKRAINGKLTDDDLRQLGQDPAKVNRENINQFLSDKASELKAHVSRRDWKDFKELGDETRNLVNKNNELFDKAKAGQYGTLDRIQSKFNTGVDTTRSLISKNPLAAAGIAAGAGALATSLMGRKRRREEGTSDGATAPKVLVGHGNPIGRSIEPVETDEGLLTLAGQIVGGALGATAGAGLGIDMNSLGGRIASGALTTAGSVAGAKVGQMLDPSDEATEVEEGLAKTIKKGWEGTKELIKNNAKIILPVAGNVAGLAYGVNTGKGQMAPAYSMVGHLAGSLASQALEATETKPAVIKDFDDFKTWKLNKYGC